METFLAGALPRRTKGEVGGERLAPLITLSERDEVLSFPTFVGEHDSPRSRLSFLPAAVYFQERATWRNVLRFLRLVDNG